MNNETLEEKIANEVRKQIKEEKEKLSEIVNLKLEYTGEFAKAYYIMQIFEKWLLK